MKGRRLAIAVVVTSCFLSAPGVAFLAAGTVNVIEHHNHPSRDGLFVDPAITLTAGAALARDLSFNGTVAGSVRAQPLYVEGGPGGKEMLIVVTEFNNVYALDAADGTVIWQRQVGPPARTANLPCGDIDPLGITGTPVIDLPSRTMFFDSMTTPDNGATIKHFIYAMNVDTGTTNSGWPVDVDANARFGTNVFHSLTQNQRGALAFLDGWVYVPYGGHAGDCSIYFGWILGVPTNNPAGIVGWATTARGGGAWSVGGVASDGTNVYLATGNTFGAGVWGGGEAILRFPSNVVFSGVTNDYWAPTNWPALDGADLDVGGSGPMIVDVPGATPSQLLVALGKDGNAYLLDRTNLGGIRLPLAQAHLSSSAISQAGSTYRTSRGTYVVFRSNGTQLTAFRITPTSPPAITNIWTVSQGGTGSPFVTSTDGTNNVIVWSVGCEGDGKLHGFDGDTGGVVYAGGGANELMAGTRRFNTAMAARGRIYVGTDNKIFSFTVPVAPIVLMDMTMVPGSSFQFAFTNVPGMAFTAFGSTDITLPFSNWSSLGFVTDNPPGLFQFSDPQAGTNPQKFYRVRTQ